MTDISDPRDGAMTEIATRPSPSALPPTEAELAAWRALSRDEQVVRYREALLAADAARVSEATMADVLTAARQRVVPRPPNILAETLGADCTHGKQIDRQQINLIGPDGRSHVFCPRCKTHVVWPASLDAGDRERFAIEVRSNALSGVKLATSEFGLDLREAKGLSFHITRTHGKCPRCCRPLLSEVSVCERCRSANLNW